MKAKALASLAAGVLNTPMFGTGMVYAYQVDGGESRVTPPSRFVARRFHFGTRCSDFAPSEPPASQARLKMNASMWRSPARDSYFRQPG